MPWKGKRAWVACANLEHTPNLKKRRLDDNLAPTELNPGLRSTPSCRSADTENVVSVILPW